MADTEAQDAGDPSDEQVVDPSTLSDAELRAFFGGEEVSEETPDDPAATETETQVEEETEAGDTAEEETETEEAKLAKMRVRPTTDKDQQVLDLYKSEGFGKSLAEAADIIYGREKPPVETVAPEGKTPEADADSPTTQLETLAAEVASLEKEAKDAAEDLDTAKAFGLQQQIMDKRIASLRLENEMQRQKESTEASEYETYRHKTVESRDRAFARFPALQNVESTDRKLFDAYVKEKQEDPDYASVFDSPKWVELIANEFAQTHDMSEQTPDLNRPAKLATRVLTSADNTSSTKPKGKLTPEGIRESIPRLDRDTLFKMLGE